MIFSIEIFLVFVVDRLFDVDYDVMSEIVKIMRIDNIDAKRDRLRSKIECRFSILRNRVFDRDVVDNLDLDEDIVSMNDDDDKADTGFAELEFLDRKLRYC